MDMRKKFFQKNASFQDVADFFGVHTNSLLICAQKHTNGCVSPDDHSWKGSETVGDALVTRRKNHVLMVRTADCAPVLLWDGAGQWIGAVHAGWKGVKAGVIQATLEKARLLGVSTLDVRAAIGPCVHQENYEVGIDVFEAFSAYPTCFRSGVNPERWMFDLSQLVALKLHEHGIARVNVSNQDTYALSDRFYSYRRSTHQGIKHQGTQFSAIVLNEIDEN